MNPERCVFTSLLHTGMKCVTMDKNKSRVFDPFDRTAVGVMKDDIVSNRQNGHCGTSTLVVRLGVA